MKKSELTNDDYVSFYKGIIYGNIVDYVDSSAKSAYRDVCRTINKFSLNTTHDAIYKTALKCVIIEVKELMKLNIKTQVEFDDWHKKACDNLISCFHDVLFTYGQAQKWLNMTLKNLSMLNHSEVQEKYEFFHVPVDNILLKHEKYKLSKAWSRINDYKEYMNFQNFFRNKYSGIPLDIEFKIWLKESRGIE